MNLEPSDLSKSTAGDPQSDLQRYGNLLINAAKEGSDPAVLGPLHHDMGKAHDELGRYADAEVHYRAAAHSFERVDQLEQSAQCWLLAGEVQAQLGLSAAQASFERARDLGVFLNNPQLQAQAYYNLGRMKESQANLNGALVDYQEAIRLIALADDDAAVQALRSEIASSLAYVQIELIVKQALELAEEINRSAENPPTASPGDLEPPSSPSNGGGRGLPGDPEASRGSSSIRRRWRGRGLPGDSEASRGSSSIRSRL